MSDILVFAPPAHEDLGGYGIDPSLTEVSGWLREQGYEFDQKNLFVECRYLNRFRLQKDFVDLSVFSETRLIDYLQGGEDDEISREANKLADMLDIDSYDTIIVPMTNELINPRRNWRLMMALPILRERVSSDQLVIVGGAQMTEDMELARLSYVDYAVDGDLELPLGNIFAHEFEGEELVVEPGVMVERDGELLRGSSYQHPMEMKPKPYFDQEILEKDAKVSAMNIPIIMYKLGRGCVQDCNFCNLFEDQSYQYKSVDKVVKELKQLKQETGAEHFWFVDRNLFNDPEYLKELALRFCEEGLDISWGGLSIIVSRDQQFFDILAEGGCSILQHGIESASNSVLHRMGKHQTRDMIESTLEKENKAGINTQALLLTDYLDESWSEYFETIDFIRQNRYLSGGRVAPLMIFPDENQPVYENLEDYNIETNESMEDLHWMERSLNFNISYKEKRDDSMEDKKRRRNLKTRFLRKIIGYELFLKNYGRKNPLAFIRFQIRKLFTKNYPDISHSFA